MITATECRGHGVECRRMATRAPSLRMKALLVDMARGWDRLAVEAEQYTLRRTSQHCSDQADAIFSRGIVLVWVVAYFLTRAAFPLALAVGSSGDRTILPAGLCPVTLLSPILWAS